MTLTKSEMRAAALRDRAAKFNLWRGLVVFEHDLPTAAYAAGLSEAKAHRIASARGWRERVIEPEAPDELIEVFAA